MNKVKVVLNRKGVSELLKSQEAMNVCREYGQRILDRALASSPGYELSTQVGKTRVNAMVSAETYEARLDNYKNNTLLKARGG